MSHGNSSRLSYDTTSYDASVKKSTEPMSYFMDSYRYRNCDVCYPEMPYIYPQQYNSTSEAHVDIENTLSSRDHKSDKKQPGGTSDNDVFREKVLKYQNNFNLKSCDTFHSNNSLLTNPKSDYRALSTQHLVFSYLPHMATDVVPLYGNPGFASSRDIAIDEYKKIMKINK